MALYQRGRIWYADYYANGERIQESTGTANRREAEKYHACVNRRYSETFSLSPSTLRCRSLASATSSTRKFTSDHGSETCRC